MHTKYLSGVLSLIILFLPLQLLVFQPDPVRAGGSRTYIPSAEIEPTSGPVGTEITLTGAGFRTSEDGITITYDGEIIKCNLIADTIGNWENTATIPPSTKGRHTVGVFGSDFTPRGVVRDNYFEVIPEISLVSQTYIEPISRKTTIKLTVMGTGFTDNESIKITFDGSELAAAVTDSSGSFNAVFEVPQVKETRDYVIAAAGSDGSSAQANFFVEKSQPPAPQLLSPVPGVKLEIFSSPIDVICGPARYLAGIFSNPRVSTPKSLKPGLATFVWTSTADSGNVSYVLEITRAYDFTSPIVKEGLSSTPYTLSGDDVLTPGAYSWRVKTVDDAGYESQWSEARKFEVIGVSDRVLTIYIVGLMVLIGALVVGIIAWRASSPR